MSAVAANGRNARPTARRPKPGSSRVPCAGTHTGTGGEVSRARASWHPRIGLGFPAPRQRWVKDCDPTGVALEQASNTARGTPGIPAESRSTTKLLRHREVPQHAGPMGSGVPRAL